MAYQIFSICLIKKFMYHKYVPKFRFNFYTSKTFIVLTLCHGNLGP